MENITIGEISAFLGFVASIIGSMEYLHLKTRKWLKQALHDEFEHVKKELKEVHAENQMLGLQGCTNFLVTTMAKAKENGALSSAEKKRLYTVYDVYKNKYHKNSYVHAEMEELKEQGII